MRGAVTGYLCRGEWSSPLDVGCSVVAVVTAMFRTTTQRQPPHNPDRGFGETARDFRAKWGFEGRTPAKPVMCSRRSETPAPIGEFRNALRRKRKRRRGISAAFSVDSGAGFVGRRPCSSGDRIRTCDLRVMRKTRSSAAILLRRRNLRLISDIKPIYDAVNRRAHLPHMCHLKPKIGYSSVYNLFQASSLFFTTQACTHAETPGSHA